MSYKRRYFYIDTENVNFKAWVPYLDYLKSTDTVYVLSSRNSNTIPVEYVTLLQKTCCKFEVVQCQVGTKNAMDFVLCACLGKSVTKAPKSEHYIISRDTGYTPVITYYEDSGVFVKQHDTIHNCLALNNHTNLDLLLGGFLNEEYCQK